MLFQDILNEKNAQLTPEFDRLLEQAYENQSHLGDLLLIQQNGFYYPEVHTWDNIDEKLSPYVMGPGSEGHADDTHYNFIGRYMTNNISKQSLANYLETVRYDPKKVEAIESLENAESYSVQIEMLIYLKIWESDSFIKSLYQLVRLIHGQHYDWHFRIKGLAADGPATGSRSEILKNLIRERLKDEFPELFRSFSNGYISQVRNAIAHSQYIILGRTISFNNYISGSKSNALPSLSFDQWIDIFHETIILYSLYHNLLNKVRAFYAAIARDNNNSFQVRINRLDPEEIIEYRKIEFDPFVQDWR